MSRGVPRKLEGNEVKNKVENCQNLREYVDRLVPFVKMDIVNENVALIDLTKNDLKKHIINVVEVIK